MWVYKKSEPGLWTVGFYEPSGRWEPESDHTEDEEAAKRVAYLNGGEKDKLPTNEQVAEFFSQWNFGGTDKFEELLHVAYNVGPAVVTPAGGMSRMRAALTDCLG